MKTLDLFLNAVFLIESIVMLGFPCHIIFQSLNDKMGIWQTLKEWIRELFYEKNIFGRILCCLALIVLLPGIVIILILQMLLFLAAFCVFVWSLGDKETD